MTDDSAETEVAQAPIEHESSDKGRYAYEKLSRSIHEPARLGILMSLIAQRNGLLFGDLKELCALTDGNLNRHLKALKQAELIEIWKGSRDKKSQTLCRVSSNGITKFLEYLAELEAIVSDAKRLVGASKSGS